jgi:hypothetical protein
MARKKGFFESAVIGVSFVWHDLTYLVPAEPDPFDDDVIWLMLMGAGRCAW